MKTPIAIFFTIQLTFLLQIPTAAQLADTALVRSLHQKAHQFWSTYPDSLLFYRDSAYATAVKIEDAVGIAESYTDLGVYHWVKGNYKEAIRAYDTSNQIFVRIKRPAKQMSNLTNLGMVYSRLGHLSKAIQYFYSALRLAESSGDKVAQAKIYNSLGVALKNQSDLEGAVEAYMKALGLFKEAGIRESVAGSYTNIGNIYMLREEYDKALDFQRSALMIFDSLQNVRGLITCYNNISDVYLAQKNLEQALTFRQRALELSNSKGFYSGEVVALLGIGQIQTELGNYKSAEQYFLKGISLAEQKNYRTEMVNLYEALSVCYKKLGRVKEALDYHEHYASLKDSLYNQQTVTTVSNLQTAYALERTEAALALLKKDNEIALLSRNRIILVAVAFVIIAAVVVLWQRSRIVREKELRAERQKLHETEQALTRAELESSRLKGEELLKEIAYKNRALTTYALSMVQKNEILEEVRESVDVIIKKPDDPVEHFKKLSRIIDYSFTIEKDWEDFRLYFEEVHHDFFSRLCEKFPDLGASDLKLCALIRLNMNVKQSASILRISPDSVKVARHRLRKKFGLQTEDNLTGFIMSL